MVDGEGEDGVGGFAAVGVEGQVEELFLGAKLLVREIEIEINALGGGEGEIVFLERGFEQATIGADDGERGVVLPSEFVDAGVGAIKQAEAIGVGFEGESALGAAI